MPPNDPQFGSSPATFADAESADTGIRSEPSAVARWLKLAVVVLPLGYLWCRLINNLQVEWSTNPQYSYGWIVPMLSLGLLLRRWQTFPQSAARKVDHSFDRSASWLPLAAFLIFAFLYLPTRLVEEATPEWRPIQWALGVEVIGLTLCAIYLGKGGAWFRQLAFPICFFFVAIPWPTAIEQPIIQSLTQVNSAISVEVLGWVGIPAIQHGNLIEVGTGTVGVSEACSGIRSFQTSLMISLFFGEFYGMALLRRLVLIPAGFILAMGFNVCRMTFLTSVAAKKGVAAISDYHDQAGITISLVCTAGLWLMALLVNKRRKPEADAATTTQDNSAIIPVGSVLHRPANFFNLSIALFAWLFVVEAGSEIWFNVLESRLQKSPAWSVKFPTGNPSLKSIPISPDTLSLLRYDEGRQAAWNESDGTHWDASYFDWKPGRVAGFLAKRHTPEICLPALGWKLVSGPELSLLNIHGVTLPLRSYVFETPAGRIDVFHCRWEAGVNKDAYVEHESARFNLIRGIWAGRGKNGQKIVELAAIGCPDARQAKERVILELESMIEVEKPKLASQNP